MFKLLMLVALAAVVCAQPQPPRHAQLLTTSRPIIPTIPTVPTRKPSIYIPNEFEIKQNSAARYEFSSDVEDKISDLTQKRTETRDGLKVKGTYSYSDGYYMRTVHYAADEKGYRVTGEEVVPLSGPQIDLSGTASISSAAHGTHHAYRIQSIPVPGPVAKIVD